MRILRKMWGIFDMDFKFDTLFKGIDCIGGFDIVFMVEADGVEIELDAKTNESVRITHDQAIELRDFLNFAYSGVKNDS